jgi:hypothetical protein
MMRLRIASVAAAASLAFGAVAVPVASATSRAGTPQTAYNFKALYTMPISGKTKDNKQFKGTFGIQRFVVSHHKAYAEGTLQGTLGGHQVTKTGVMLPASLQGAPNGQARDAQTCPVLHLVLGPIHLDLLGLVVNLGGGKGANLPITLNITAVSGPGNLLGNLLCGLSGLLNQNGTLAALQGDVKSLTAALNGILGVLGGV